MQDEVGIFQKVAPMVIVALLSCLGTLGGQYLLMKGTEHKAEQEADAEIVRATYDRMKELEGQVANLQAQVIKQNAEIVQLKVQLNSKVDIYAMLEEVLDGVPFPAWIKRVERDANGSVRFPMAMINKAYEYRYGISKHRYAGSTDAEIWPKEVADGFRHNDQLVLAQRSSGTYQEQFPKNPHQPISKTNPLIQKIVVKVYLKFPGHDPMIFGMSMPQPSARD